jgi:chemotaxis protein methyltransferase CheR
MSLISDEVIHIARDRISDLIGIYYSKDHLFDFRQTMEKSFSSFGFPDLESWIQRILSASFSNLEIMHLAKVFTIGESYFFREPMAFQVLTNKILPAKILKDDTYHKTIRIWCAGCSTGEEAYTLSIVLHQFAQKIPINYQILATDIHGENLEKAKKGVYGKWSFRGVQNLTIHQFFDFDTPSLFKIKGEYAENVEFNFLNLVQDPFPSIKNKTTDLDIIFCRNVLMYFSPDQQKKVLDNFYQCLSPGGYMFLSVTEISSFLETSFQIQSEGGMHFYRKPELFEKKGEYKKENLLEDFRREISHNLISENLTAEKIPVRFIPLQPRMEPIKNPQEMADIGYLSRASVENLVLLKEDSLNPKNYYLQSLILFEQGKIRESISFLKKCLYLDPDHILSHFFLGVYYQKLKQQKLSQKYFLQTIRLLAKISDEDEIPDSDHLSAGRLKVMLQSWVKEDKL